MISHNQEDSGNPTVKRALFNPSIPEYLSFNLHDVNEISENNLGGDPSLNGPLYMKILVKCIGLLNCEDDVQRLLDEAIYTAYVQTVLPKIKLSAAMKLSQTLQSISQNLSSEDEVKLHGHLFEEYVFILLETLLIIFQRTIYIYKLLETSKVGKAGHGSEELSKETQTKISTFMISQIHNLEAAVQREVANHLIEADVQNISDIQDNTKPKFMFEEDEQFMKDDKTIFRSSIWHAALIYTELYKYSNKLFFLLDSSFSIDLVQPQQQPTTGKSTVLKQQQKQHPPAASPFQSTLLSFIQRSIEDELIPVVQSWVNQELRYLQTSTVYSSELGSDEKPLSIELLLSNASSVLFKLWVRLFNHRDFISVVFDRLLKTVITVLKESEEYLFHSLNLVTYLAKIDFMQFLERDSNFLVNKSRLYLSNANMFDIINKLQISMVNFRSFRISTAGDATDLHKLYIEEFIILQSAFKELQGLPLPKVRKRIFISLYHEKHFLFVS
jgi:hypothetical protein